MEFQKVVGNRIIIKQVMLTKDNKEYTIIKKVYDLNNNLLEEEEILNTNSRKMIDKAIAKILKKGYIEL